MDYEDDEEFSTTLKHRREFLLTPQDVVRFSFIAQNSISYLDLTLCRYSKDSSYSRALCDCSFSKFIVRDFINTQEKCRKFFTPSRSLLYTLHLDLPKGRECSLKVGPEPVTFADDPRIPHITEITPVGDCIDIFIEDALNLNVPKLRILKWILKVPFCKAPLLSRLPIETANKFIDCFYPKITDYAIFKDFIMQFSLMDWMLKPEIPKNPEFLEFFLYYALYYGRRQLKGIKMIDSAINLCILRGLFLYIRPILKFMNVQKFTSFEYRLFTMNISPMRLQLDEEVFDKAEKLLKPERLYYTMLIANVYMLRNQHSCTESASEALRLIWCSVPNAFITYDEVKKVYAEVLSDEEINGMYAFYVKAVGEFHEYIEPRSLRHLCRTVVRRILCQNNRWIPEGISQTGLPKSLESFLNLD